MQISVTSLTPFQDTLNEVWVSIGYRQPTVSLLARSKHGLHKQPNHKITYCLITSGNCINICLSKRTRQAVQKTTS
jgi:hypothetical protein